MALYPPAGSAAYQPLPLPPPAPLPPVIEKHRLSSDAYIQLVGRCPVIAVNNDTQPLQAGFQLGVQHVLQKLREGFVVGL